MLSVLFADKGRTIAAIKPALTVHYITLMMCTMLTWLVGVLAVVTGVAPVGAKPLDADGLPTVSLPLTVNGNLDMVYTVAVHVGGKCSTRF